MNSSPKRTFTGDFKVFFLRGLGILLPSVLTIWIVVQAYNFVNTRIAQPINGITRDAIVHVLPYLIGGSSHQPDWYKVTPDELAAARVRREADKLPKLDDGSLTVLIRQNDLKSWWEQHIYFNTIGLIIAILLFYLAGRIFGSFLGRRIALRFERLISSVPIFKQVYPYVKQLVEFVLGEKKLEFNRVVAVEYPRKGIWSIGFLTGPAIQDIARMAGLDPRDLVTVFMPSSPTPFTGYAISVPRTDIREVSITVEEALRFIISGGVLVPDAQMVPAPAPQLQAVSTQTGNIK